ncbi:MAG: ABC-type iron transport system, permease component [Candidatus Fermentimicrarchaeum limneticum]|uniref:ABC-type iron transport system, permease component n=1 Tax=Fermentimicrarchaeum limneticum TaxID=2795018 RepID=A0A7D5XMB5_FERL1|nr:MAG: ABC-type iron transport system, permease component [Candidatus Fermentimicrarchaeum limneticum]
MGGADRFASGKSVEIVFYSVVILFFLLLVFAPILYIVLRGCPDSNAMCFPSLYITKEMSDALINSFSIAFIAVVLDIIFGIPIAWVIARYKTKLKVYLDFLVDMPLIMPTAALGFSVALFWGGEGIGLLSKGFWMIVAVHVAFTYPYIVRTLSAAIEEVDITYEMASRTLGSSPLTAFRTITLPLFKSGLLIAALLAFTRSLSETGATMMAVGTGQFFAATAPAQTLLYKNNGDMTSAISLSIILIAASTILLTLVRYLANRFGIPIVKVYPSFEKSLNNLKLEKNVLAFAFFIAIILLPSFYLLEFVSYSRGELGGIINSIGISFLIAFAATVANLIFGVGMALLIGRNKYGAGPFFEFLTDMVMVMPTVALGLSLGMFWNLFQLDELFVLAMVHVSFSYPYIVKPVAASIRELDKDLEDAARVLGATPFKVFTTITLPLIMPSILAGAVMAFMRSLSETGATLTVSKTFKTIPVLIVEFVKASKYGDAAFASALLLGVSFIAAYLLRRK